LANEDFTTSAKLADESVKAFRPADFASLLNQNPGKAGAKVAE
jgi:hypothetical protein